MFHIMVQVVRPTIAGTHTAPVVGATIFLGEHHVEIDLEHTRDHECP